MQPTQYKQAVHACILSSNSTTFSASVLAFEYIYMYALVSATQNNKNTSTQKKTVFIQMTNNIQITLYTYTLAVVQFVFLKTKTIGEHCSCFIPISLHCYLINHYSFIKHIPRLSSSLSLLIRLLP